MHAFRVGASRFLSLAPALAFHDMTMSSALLCRCRHGIVARFGASGEQSRRLRCVQAGGALSCRRCLLPIFLPARRGMSFRDLGLAGGSCFGLRLFRRACRRRCARVRPFGLHGPAGAPWLKAQPFACLGLLGVREEDVLHSQLRDVDADQGKSMCPVLLDTSALYSAVARMARHCSGQVRGAAFLSLLPSYRVQTACGERRTILSGCWRKLGARSCRARPLRRTICWNGSRLGRR